MKTKYIRNSSKFVVFPDNCQHREMAVKGLGPDKLIHGAGFVKFSLNDNEIVAECYGHSESLNRQPRRDDHTAMVEALIKNSANYIILREKTILFSDGIDVQNVAKAAFFGKTDYTSAGKVTFSINDQGKIKINCDSDEDKFGVSSTLDDYKNIAQLMELPQSDLCVNATVKCKI